ncbi:MAG TPA: adenylate/guanylate cyclase domain-containing protein [Terriglobia bacterium]|nr:adenylate/guanylate cyclase domain-containing protein [Terriglobia bacterium]
MPLLLILVVGAGILYNRLNDERARLLIRRKFQPHLALRVIERAMTLPLTLRLEPERREMSVLFSDIRAFTGLSEKMPAEEVVSFLNRYFSRMTSLIFKNSGTLDKFMGSGVMAFWGHPLAVRNHALRATVCALEMVQEVEDLRSAMMLPGSARFEIGIGVHTGPMVVGDVGSESHKNYTVIGDHVSLGARLESVSRHYDAPIVISEPTYQACKEFVCCREIDTISIDGAGALTIYEPLGLLRASEERRRRRERRGAASMVKQVVRAYVFARHGERRVINRRAGSERLFVTGAQEEFAAKYAAALALYRAGDLDGASIAFDRVLLLNPADGPARLLKSRISRRSTHGETATFTPTRAMEEDEALSWQFMSVGTQTQRKS